MADKFAELKKKYEHQVPANALILNLVGHKALRVECPTIGKEFTDNAYIGWDPEGYLFYSHISSLDPSRKVQYKITRIVNASDNKPCCWIQFYTTSINNCLAEFLAYDPQETVKGSGMDGWSAPGNWKDLSVGSVTATIRKYDDENTITITVGPVNKKAVITDSKGYLNQKEVDGVQGLLYYKNINDINNGLFANYNEDRIVFYQKQWFATDFVSYFIPYESNTKSLGIPGTTEVEFENIVWSNT